MKQKKIVSLILAAAMIFSSAAAAPTAALAGEVSGSNAQVNEAADPDASGSGSTAEQEGSDADSSEEMKQDAGAESSDTDSNESDSQDTDSTENVQDPTGTDQDQNDGDQTDADQTDTDQTDDDAAVSLSISVLPEQYQMILDTEGNYICTYAPEGEDADTATVLKDCWILAELSVTEEDGVRTAEAWQILDPATAAEVSDAVLIRFDAEGKGQTTETYTGVAAVFYNGTTADYYAENGRILTGSADKYLSIEDQLYHVEKDGRFSLYTGYCDGHFYSSGVMLKSMNILVDPVEQDGTTVYEYVSPASYSSCPDAIIYQIAADGTAALYTGSAVISLTYDGKTYLYYATEGKLQRRGTGGMLLQAGTLYYVAVDGRAALCGGVYGNYFYVGGKIRRSTGTYYAYYNSCLYKADKTGKVVKYTKTKGSVNFYAIALHANGKPYLCYANRKTSAAKIVIADRSKTTCYQKIVDSCLYNVSYSTGRVSVFTGVYNKYYYSGGKVATSKLTHNIVYRGYVYRVTRKGAASVYIRSKKKSGSYCLYVDGTFYYVSYSTGKVTGTPTAAAIAAASKTAETVKPNSTTFTANTSAARANLVRTAMSFLGTEEKTPLHDEILALYNSYDPLPRGTVMLWTYEWCAAYVSAMFIKTGYTGVGVVDCSCKYQVNYWKKTGRWIENDAYVPKTGDLIYYHWNDKKPGDCTGNPNHVGIVVSVSNGIITTIEGNINGYKDSDGQTIRHVDYRNIQVNGQYIRGFASPNY